MVERKEKERGGIVRKILIDEKVLLKITYQKVPIRQMLRLNLTLMEFAVLCNFFAHAKNWTLSVNRIRSTIGKLKGWVETNNALNSLEQKGYIFIREDMYLINLEKINDDYLMIVDNPNLLVPLSSEDPISSSGTTNPSQSDYEVPSSGTTNQTSSGTTNQTSSGTTTKYNRSITNELKQPNNISNTQNQKMSNGLPKVVHSKEPNKISFVEVKRINTNGNVLKVDIILDKVDQQKIEVQNDLTITNGIWSIPEGGFLEGLWKVEFINPNKRILIIDDQFIFKNIAGKLSISIDELSESQIKYFTEERIKLEDVRKRLDSVLSGICPNLREIASGNNSHDKLVKHLTKKYAEMGYQVHKDTLENIRLLYKL